MAALLSRKHNLAEGIKSVSSATIQSVLKRSLLKGIQCIKGN